MKRFILIILCAALFFTTCLSLASCGSDNQTTQSTTDKDQNMVDYDEALSLLQEGEYEEAKILFEKLGDYKDAADYLSKFYYMPTAFIYNLHDKAGIYEIVLNENNLPSKEITHRDDMDSVCEFTYNEQGDIIKQATTANGDLYTYDYTYNPDATINSAIYIGPDGSTLINKYTYDDNGRLILETYEDKNGTILYSCTFLYDDKGNVIAQDIVEGEYSYHLDIEYIYDDNSMLISEICHYGDGVQESLDYTYDENGNVTKKLLTSYDGSQSYYEYTYDTNGNVIREVLTDSQGIEQYVDIEYVLVYIPQGITTPTHLFFEGYWGSIL